MQAISRPRPSQQAVVLLQFYSPRSTSNLPAGSSHPRLVQSSRAHLSDEYAALRTQRNPLPSRLPVPITHWRLAFCSPTTPMPTDA